MKFYNNIDIQFNIGGCEFHAVNLLSAAIDHDIPLHSHGRGCYEIHYISDGYGTLNANGQEYEIIPNTLFVTGPDVAHSQFTDVQKPMTEWGIYLKTNEEEGEYDSIISLFLSQKFWIGQDEQNLGLLFEKLFMELDNRLDGYRNMAELLISEIIISIVRNYTKRLAESDDLTCYISERTSLIIEEYFLYEYRTATLTELSERLGLCTRQTQRIIKRYYQSNFNQMRTKAKMAAAELLLSDNSLSLSAITELLGYSSQEYFAAAFKKHYNTSPGKFRKAITKKI